jgi:hypothetical protein
MRKIIKYGGNGYEKFTPRLIKEAKPYRGYDYFLISHPSSRHRFGLKNPVAIKTPPKSRAGHAPSSKYTIPAPINKEPSPQRRTRLNQISLFVSMVSV